MSLDRPFLSRWSLRKAEARSGVRGEEDDAARPTGTTSPAREPGSDATAGTASNDAAGAPSGLVELAPSTPAVPAVQAVRDLPTLADVAALSRSSDYSRFVLPGVEPAVSNAAMRKLFSDPHFNVMDGLDTYIDDYGKPDPIPLSMLRRMNQSAALGLFAEEAPPATAEAAAHPLPAEASPDGADPAAMAQSTEPAAARAVPEIPADDDPDLQLQPDDADRRAGAGPRPRA